MVASKNSPVTSAVPDLIGALAARQTQAGMPDPPYSPRTVAQGTMSYWLARAAKAAREAADRKQVHVAASANKDQSSIYRFEQGKSWPQDTDLLVAAYADDLDIDPIDLWQAALDMWRESGEQANVAQLAARRNAKKSEREATESDLDADLLAEDRRVSASKTAAKRTSRARKPTNR